MSKIRIASLFVPQFPLAAWLRREPALANQPVAILDVKGAAARVLCATAPARREGVRLGCSLSQMRALLPEAAIRDRDPEAERSSQEALLQIGEAFSPYVEEAGPGLLYLNLEGVRDEEGVVGAIIGSATEAGLGAQVGVGGRRLSARIAAQRASEAPTIISPGADREFLLPLAIAWLNPRPPLAATLKRWGIESIGALIALPEGEIALRLGKEGFRLHRDARGIDETPLMSRRKPPTFSERITLEWPICEIEPFIFLANEILTRLCHRLEGRGLACSRLQMSLALDPDGEEIRTLRIAAPTSDVKTLLHLIRLELASFPPRAPITALALIAFPDLPRQIQTSLFGPSAPAPDRLAAMIARLSALLGPDRIGSPKTAAGYLPERGSIVPYAPPPPPKVPPSWEEILRDGRTVLLAIRLLRPALPLEIVTDEGEPAAPTSVRSQGSGVVKIAGLIRAASGPWRLEEGEWSEEGWGRDYWDVELLDGGLYRIFYDGARWFADGIYD